MGHQSSLIPTCLISTSLDCAASQIRAEGWTEMLSLLSSAVMHTGRGWKSLRKSQDLGKSFLLHPMVITVLLFINYWALKRYFLFLFSPRLRWLYFELNTDLHVKEFAKLGYQELAKNKRIIIPSRKKVRVTGFLSGCSPSPCDMLTETERRKGDQGIEERSWWRRACLISFQKLTNTALQMKISAWNPDLVGVNNGFDTDGP